MTDLQLVERAEKNSDGEYIHEEKIPGPDGTTKTRETNVTRLLTPGKRITGDESILVHEAKQHAEKGVDNPAYPATKEIANEACTKIIEDEGLEPAWKDHEPTRWER